MNPRPIAVKTLDDYKILITFANNELRVFDMASRLNKPLYQKLRNKSFFSLAKADGMTVYWDDDVDICPDVLYECSVDYVEEKEKEYV